MHNKHVHYIIILLAHSARMKGHVHAYYGLGVGKTSRAVGLAVRALGADKSVFFIQFLKDGTSSEIRMLKKHTTMRYRGTGSSGFIFGRNPTEEEKQYGTIGLDWCHGALESGYDLVVADEILNAWGLGLLSLDDIRALIAAKKPHTDLVLTGRPKPEGLLHLCGYATEFVHVAHPYDCGYESRKGIDY